MREYDVVVIGAGVCGLQSAFRAVNRGMRVFIVEKERLGGTCLTRGCIPTKAMIRSAEVADLARRGREFGVRIEGEVQPDLELVVERKDAIVDRVEATNQRDIEATDALDLLRGTACFVDEHTITVNGEEVTADAFVIATGARPFVPDWPGVDEVGVLTSRELLDLKDRPRDLVVIGGGYIGIECAQMMARLGVDVTIVQRSVLLKEEDQELVDILREVLGEDGIDIHEGTAVKRFEPVEGDRALVVASREGEEVVFEADEVLVAVGRVPNGDTLNLEAAGVETFGGGWVRVDDRLRTSQEHIVAVGDAIGRYMFTHVGREEAEVAIVNLLDEGEGMRMDYHAAPYAVFSDPPLARVGMTLEEALNAGHDAVEASYGYEHVGKAMCLGEEEGLMKVIADEDTGEVLGFHIVGHNAGDLLAEATVTMHERGSVKELSEAMHIHPTMSEAVEDTAYTMALKLGLREW